MSLTEGETLEEMDRFGGQGEQDSYIGSFGKQPLTEVFLKFHPDLAGPFQGANAIRQFQDTCGVEINSDVPVVFAHNDLVPQHSSDSWTQSEGSSNH
ncbi:uncharacterized protein N7525_003449 [Penicillium rubens]|uniref:uncharacterized protein n=1 Tax=Penicillium rubens TaxID=1108849 RepID=UPI002A5ADB11|nr:uncharacterized protein N7525_003449 [Penicillium rubens]KAJ5838261.1 hypothetical protein N7525_003449 [Penicillium rubens]